MIKLILLANRWTGIVLAGDSIIQWIGAIHFGAFGGWPIKLLWMLGGVGLSVSAIIGVVLFVQRR